MVNSDSSPLGCTGKAVLCSHEILSPLQATAVQKINEDFKSTKKYKSKINLVVKFTSGGTDFELAWTLYRYKKACGNVISFTYTNIDKAGTFMELPSTVEAVTGRAADAGFVMPKDGVVCDATIIPRRGEFRHLELHSKILHFHLSSQLLPGVTRTFLCYERVHAKITRLKEFLYVQFGGSKCYLNLGEHSFSRLFPV